MAGTSTGVIFDCSVYQNCTAAVGEDQNAVDDQQFLGSKYLRNQPTAQFRKETQEEIRKSEEALKFGDIREQIQRDRHSVG